MSVQTFDDYGLGPEPDSWAEDAPPWAARLLVAQLENAEALARIESTMTDVAAIAARIKTEVTPFLDGLAKSPLVKMLGVKTK